MNRKLTTTALVLAAAFAGSAFAESPNAGVGRDTFSGARTRADVQAELVAYKQAGVNPWSTQYNPLRSFKSATTRADVTADYLASRAEVAALNSEDSGSAYLAQARVTGVPPTRLAGQPRNAQ
ncbi:DUF4148 domain-containing protein [Ramlibacter sp. XY19]|uniref:DUF4148 domain-containing protein n=1 Tax=Ramlibacter paludis TaxID=2908000 RepID=UPI0023DB6DAD|nr:DUF4148 domain-containing protein [Ramlibacter paludis]MCG2594467.1 DUF4148 domain-containing protein [Ramlibacter paludis]